MKKFIIPLLLFCAAVISVSLFGCADKEDKNGEKSYLTVSFYFNNELYDEVKVRYGEPVSEPAAPQYPSDYVFKGWYKDCDYNEIWNFENAVTINFSLYAYTVKDDGETFNVRYKSYDNQIIYKKVKKNAFAELIIPEERNGYTFDCWEYNGIEYDFTIPITQNIELVARWQLVKYKVNFCLENKIVSSVEYDVENKTVKTPEIPYKEHFTSHWDSFNLTYGNVTVYGHYTPVTYKAQYFVSGSLYKEVLYTILDAAESFPKVPEIKGYAGSWDKLPDYKGDMEINAVYTPINYNIYFYSDGKLIKTLEYNIETITIDEPEVPEKTGYSGKWENYSLNLSDISVSAIYTPKKFVVTFVADGQEVSQLILNYEQENITAPPVPKKYGYDGAWEKFSYNDTAFPVNAIYTPKVHTVSYFAEGIKVGTAKFDIENLPDINITVPQKAGYFGKWEMFEYADNDVNLNAIYSPITYYATFTADGNEIERIPFSIENMSITPPAVPAKVGYVANWSEFYLQLQDVEIIAVYTPIIYKAYFIADKLLIDCIEFTIESTTLNEPKIPARKGYTANWQQYEIKPENLNINAEYKAITYYAEFVADGVVTDVIEFTVENLKIKEPAVPQKDGYTGRWQNYVLTAGNITISAIYTTNEFCITFIADERVIDKQYFTIENFQSITAPAVPEKSGYNGSWENYEFTYGDICVNAQYTLINYYVTFIAHDTVIDYVEFNIENMIIAEPTVPPLRGYRGLWNEYDVQLRDFTVTATYFMEFYTLTFIADENIVATLQYCIDSINEIIYPQVPEKDGYVGNWEDFELNCEDLTIKAVYVSDFDFTTLSYTLLSDGTYSVTGYSGTRKSIVIPSEYNSLPVTKIGEYAFINSQINRVEIYEGLTCIENYAFMNCANLIDINFPQSLKEIGENAFGFCGIEKLVLPTTVVTVGEYAFSDCTNLEYAEVNGLSVLPSNLFTNCSSLKNLVIGNSVNIIKTKAINNCALLSEIILGNGLQYIESYAFNKLPSLEKIEIPSSVKKIDVYAFYEVNLQSVVFADPNGWFFSPNGNNISSDRFYDPKQAAVLFKQYIQESYIYKE